MGLSTERKVFLGLFLVAGGAFLMDQAILGPSGAEASSIESGLELITETVTEPGKFVDSTTLNDVSAASVLNERLEAVKSGIGDQASLSALFTDPSSIIEQAQSKGMSEAPQVSPALAVSLPSLSAVMPSKSGGAAVLDGVLLRSGSVSKDGYRLITVQKRSIILEKSGKQYTLELPVLGG